MATPASGLLSLCCKKGKPRKKFPCIPPPHTHARTKPSALQGPRGRPQPTRSDFWLQALPAPTLLRQAPGMAPWPRRTWGPGQPGTCVGIRATAPFPSPGLGDIFLPGSISGGGSRSGAGGAPSRAFLAEQHSAPASPLERSQDRAGSGEESLAGAAGNPETAPVASGGGCAVRTCLRYRRKCLGPGNPRCPDAPQLGFRARPASGCGFPASQGTPGPGWWSGRIVSWVPGPLFPLPRAPPSQPPGSGPLMACAVPSTHHALCLQPAGASRAPPAQLSPSRARRLRVPASFTVLSAPAAPPLLPTASPYSLPWRTRSALKSAHGG